MNTSTNSKRDNPLSKAWWSSDSEDEDELDVRQLVARQNAEKKKKLLAAATEVQTKATTTTSIKEVDVVDSKPSAAASQVNESQTSSEYTPKISNICEQIGKGKQPPNVRGKVDGVKKLDYIREEDNSVDCKSLNKGAYGTLSSEQANDFNRDISMTSDNTAMQKVDEHIPSPSMNGSKQSMSMSTTTASAALKSNSNMEATKPEPSKQTCTEPIIGTEVRNRANADWIELKKCLLVRAVGSCSPKDRVASFDLDHTLVNWRIAGWPSRPEHYELWNAGVIEKCRRLHDDGYKLVIFSNQGGIKGALTGKKASTVKGVIDWIAKLISRPVYAVVSTKTDSGYHKGNAGMWQIMEDYCNCGKQVSPELSFFVGDADGVGDSSADAQCQQHQQTGTDKLFAVNVGKLRKQNMNFHTPNEYFGDSDVQSRRTRSTVEAPPPLSKETILAHTALLGGYFTNTPTLLILVGVQGSGKSTFTKYLTDNSDGRWCQFSQDTIKDGGPGTRQAVEQAAKEALKRGKNVVIDRMHLDSEQRGHFVEIGKECQVSIHALVMLASKEEVADRVKRRTNHPGKVEGENGARIAVSSVSKLIHPSYDEGFELISYSRQINGRLWGAYCQVGSTVTSEIQVPKTIQLYNAKENVALSMLTLGTMGIKKNVATSIITQALQIGVQSIDTAPTYGNEEQIGDALRVAQPTSVTIKVPKRATSVKQVREEVMKSLSLLQQSRVDIILLHWPCDFIEANTLADVWKELESIKKEGKCLAIGVSNFTIMALKQLLSSCTIKPALNQVERHPLLPQYDLLQYCESQDIIVQSHSPLGGGCGGRSELLLGNNTITRVAQEAKMSPAQVLLCWNIQQNIPICTKFSSDNHGKENIALLQEHTKLRLSPEQMKAIDNLGISVEPHRFVKPTFMYRKGASYSWGDTPPSR